MGELMAVLDLLSSTAGTGEELLALHDSQYVINSLTVWLSGRRRRGWKRGDGEPVLNTDLMKQLDQALRSGWVHFGQVKGHVGHPLNEAADERIRAVTTAHRDGTPAAREPGFPGAGKRPALPEPLRDDVPEQLALLELPGKWV